MVRMRHRFRFERLETRTLMAAFAIGGSGDEPENPDTQVMASIDVEQLQGLRAVAVEISFDRDRLQLDDFAVRAGSAWGGKGMAIANIDNEQGRANIFVFSARETTGASGSLLEFDFQRNASDDDERPWQIELENLRVNDGEIDIQGQADRVTVNTGKSTPAKLRLALSAAGEGEAAEAAQTSQATTTAPQALAIVDEAVEQILSDLDALPLWLHWWEVSHHRGVPSGAANAALPLASDSPGASEEHAKFCFPEHSRPAHAWWPESPLLPGDPAFIGPVFAGSVTPPLPTPLESSFMPLASTVEPLADSTRVAALPGGTSKPRPDDLPQPVIDSLGASLAEARRNSPVNLDAFVSQKKTAMLAVAMGPRSPHDSNQAVFDEYHLAGEMVRGKLSPSAGDNRTEWKGVGNKRVT